MRRRVTGPLLFRQPGFFMDDFKEIELKDREVFVDFLREYPPTTSELTFTNLFMWRRRYRPVWRTWNDNLLVALRQDERDPFGLPPIGPDHEGEALAFLCSRIAQSSPVVQVCRMPEAMAEARVDPERYEIVEDRDNSDYVYLAQDLITLSGNKFHKKKNHVNKFVKNHEFEYRTLDADIVSSFLDLQEVWCELRNCEENPGLFYENVAIYQALSHFEELAFTGGAVIIDGKVEAFALGELLNPETAVIHVEKANPDVPGLYAAINQLFCEDAWADVTYVNREQDLGIEGLRRAKLSYHPHHLVEKVTVIPKG